MEPQREVTREEFDSLTRRVSAHEERLNRGDVAIALLQQRLDGMSADIADIKAILRSIQEKPARRWDSLISTALQWAVTLFLAYIVLGTT